MKKHAQTQINRDEKASQARDADKKEIQRLTELLKKIL